MQVAVYGGSFNPPHVGHAMVASWLIWTRRADSVWFLPAFEHAFAKRMAPFDRRVAWCGALARELGPAFEVCEVERELPTPSYTLNTLLHLEAQHPEHHFRLVVGADVLAQAADWYRWSDIMARFTPIIVGRSGYPPVEGAPTFPGISSTEIRERLAAGRPVDHLLTRGVLELLP